MKLPLKICSILCKVRFGSLDSIPGLMKVVFLLFALELSFPAGGYSTLLSRRYQDRNQLDFPVTRSIFKFQEFQ